MVDPKYVVDESGNRTAVTLSTKDWERVLEELEELDDIRAYDQARKDDSEHLCFEEAVSEIEKTEDDESRAIRSRF